MSDERTTRPSPARPPAERSGRDRTDWRALRERSDDEARALAIEDPDAPPTDDAFWREARVTWPSGKTKISLYVDNDVLDWFKRGGKGYQTRVNAVLRSYFEAAKTRG